MNGPEVLVRAHAARIKLANTGLPVRLIVRTAVPWETMTKGEFYAQNDWLLTPMAYQTATVGRVFSKRLTESWEAAYGLDYCRYRATVRDACDTVNMRVPWDNVSRGISNVRWEGGDEILVCVDDDDTFEPGLVPALKAAFVDGVDIVRWPRRMNVLGYEQPDSVYSTTYLDTCNWAVRKSFLYYWGWREALEFLAFHWIAHQMTAKRLLNNTPPPKKLFGLLPTKNRPQRQFNHPNVVNLDRPYSTYYVHTGSISYLDNKHGSYSGDELTKFLKGKSLHPLYVR